jgi:hypothetical protein
LAEEVAQFIVTACNMHEELVDLCDMVLHWFKIAKHQGGEYSEEYIQLLEQALAKARES